jgi:hypothetical protein
MNTAALFRRLDNLAYEQLCAEAARLVEENEHLRIELSRAEDDAEHWHTQAMRLQEEACADGSHAPGLTQSGALVRVPVEARA